MNNSFLSRIESAWISAQDHLAPIAVTFLPVAYFAQAVEHRLGDYHTLVSWPIAIVAGYAMEAGGMKAFKSWARGEGWLMVAFYVVLAISAVVGLEQSTAIIDLLIGFVAYGLPFLVYSTAAQTIVRMENAGTNNKEERRKFEQEEEVKDRKLARRIEAAQAMAKIKATETVGKVSETLPMRENLPQNLRQLRKMPEHMAIVAGMTVNEIVARYGVHERTAAVWKKEFSNGGICHFCVFPHVNNFLFYLGWYPVSMSFHAYSPLVYFWYNHRMNEQQLVINSIIGAALSVLGNQPIAKKYQALSKNTKGWYALALSALVAAVIELFNCYTSGQCSTVALNDLGAFAVRLANIYFASQAAHNAPKWLQD